MSIIPPNISLIGVASDSGGLVSGASTAPAKLRQAGVIESLLSLGLQVEDSGNISLTHLPLSKSANISGIDLTKATPEELLATNLSEVFLVCRELNLQVNQALEEQKFPLILGGDHSLSIGSISAFANYYQKKNQRTGLIWIDTHADLNLPRSSPSKCIFGMPTAFLLGRSPGLLSSLARITPAIDPKHIVYVGLRDVDEEEKTFISASKLKAFTMQDIDILGMSEVMSRAISIASAGTAGFVASYDLDVCDPSLAPATGTPIRGGFTFREAHLSVELLAASNKMLGFELVEFNPSLDIEDKTCQLAISLVESAMGKTIL